LIWTLIFIEIFPILWFFSLLYLAWWWLSWIRSNCKWIFLSTHCWNWKIWSNTLPLYYLWWRFLLFWGWLIIWIWKNVKWLLSWITWIYLSSKTRCRSRSFFVYIRFLLIVIIFTHILKFCRFFILYLLLLLLECILSSFLFLLHYLDLLYFLLLLHILNWIIFVHF
jgi:hypothetical protein